MGGDASDAFLVCGCLLPGLYLAWKDATEFILPHHVTIPMLLMGLAYGLYFDKFSYSLLGAGTMFCVMLFVPLAASKVFGKAAEIGGGDIWLSTALGAWFGLHGVLVIMIWSCIGSIIYGIIKLLYSGRVNTSESKQDDEIPPGAIPFGTFMIIATWAFVLKGVF